jgi:hypothetical protein
MENFHLIEVKYLGTTNSRGSRVKMTSNRFNESVTIPYDYKLNKVTEMAEEYLKEKGFTIVGQGEGKNVDFVITSDFKSIK